MRNHIDQMKSVIALTDISLCPAPSQQLQEVSAPLESLIVPTLPLVVSVKP
jgi:hypothetical protein